MKKYSPLRPKRRLWRGPPAHRRRTDADLFELYSALGAGDAYLACKSKRRVIYAMGSCSLAAAPRTTTWPSTTSSGAPVSCAHPPSREWYVCRSRIWLHGCLPQPQHVGVGGVRDAPACCTPGLWWGLRCRLGWLLRPRVHHHCEVLAQRGRLQDLGRDVRAGIADHRLLSMQAHPSHADPLSLRDFFGALPRCEVGESRSCAQCYPTANPWGMSYIYDGRSILRKHWRSCCSCGAPFQNVLESDRDDCRTAHAADVSDVADTLSRACLEAPLDTTDCLRVVPLGSRRTAQPLRAAQRCVAGAVRHPRGQVLLHSGRVAGFSPLRHAHWWWRGTWC